jgi:hypothetical protein
VQEISSLINHFAREQLRRELQFRFRKRHGASLTGNWDSGNPRWGEWNDCKFRLLNRLWYVRLSCLGD